VCNKSDHQFKTPPLPLAPRIRKFPESEIPDSVLDSKIAYPDQILRDMWRSPSQSQILGPIPLRKLYKEDDYIWFNTLKYGILSNEYRLKIKNNTSTVQLNGIPTFLLIKFFKIKYGYDWAPYQAKGLVQMAVLACPLYGSGPDWADSWFMSVTPCKLRNSTKNYASKIHFHFMETGIAQSV
jgi:hypothetical protein